MGAGAVHHVAWASPMDDHEEWQRRVAAAGLRPTPIIDRFWFRSIYFREPSGVLFEIATLGPGFGVDEDPEHLGEALVLPPDFEHLRERARARADSAAEAASTLRHGGLTTRGPLVGALSRHHVSRDRYGISPWSRHFLKMVLNWRSAALAASCGVILPCATWANICGMSPRVKISPMAALP